MSEHEAVVGAEPVARRMTRGFAALSAGRVATLALQLLSFALVAAALGPSGVGAYTFALAFYGLFAYVTNFGVRTIAMRDITQAPEREREVVVNLFYLRVLLGLVAYAALVVVLLLGGYSAVERQAGLVTGVLLVVLALESFQVILEVRLRMGWVSIAAVVQGVVLAVGTVVAMWQDAGVLGFLWVFVASNVANFAIVGTVALRQVDGLAWRPRPRLWGHLAKAALALGLAQLFITLYYRLDLLILAAIKPADDVGQYGAAYRVLETFIVVPSLAMTVLTPVIAASVVAGAVVLQRRYGHLMHLIAVLSFPVAVAGALTAARLFPTLPGFGEFGGAGVALAVLSPAAPCIFFGTALSAVLVSAHEQRRLLSVSFVGLLLNVALNVVLIPRYSYVGAAVATTLTEIAVVCGLVRAVRLHVGAAWPWRRILRAARASAVLALVLVVTLPLPVWLQLGLGVLAYVVAVFPTGSLRWDDLGGLMGGDGAVGVVPAPVAGAVEGDAVERDVRGVDPSGPFGTWRGLLGVGSCRLEQGASMLPAWLPVVARLAGADPVVLRLDSAAAPAGRTRDLVWPWFLTAVELGAGVDPTEVADRWPRLSALADRSSPERAPAPVEEEVAR